MIKEARWKKQTEERLCSTNDDASAILDKIRSCDLLVLASPVCFARLSGTMACLIDRTRCFMFGKNGHLALKEKVGVALAVGWCRSFGMESTLASIHNAFQMHGMVDSKLSSQDFDAVLEKVKAGPLPQWDQV